MATSLGGWFDKVFFDAHGEPCASGELRFYQTGTDIPQGVATFDGTPLGAVVRLDDDGRPESDFRFYTDKIYRVVLVDADGVVVNTTDGVAIPEGEGGAMYNPMTAAGDLIVGGTDGEAERLAAGNEGEVLKVVSGVPTWATDAEGMQNPMTDPGDLIVGTTGGEPERLAPGADGDILGSWSFGGNVLPKWEAGTKKYRNVYGDIPSSQIDDGYLGCLFYLSASGQTLDLPSSATIPSKSFIDFVCLNDTATLTITPQGTTTLNEQAAAVTIGGKSATLYRLTFLGHGVSGDEWALGGSVLPDGKVKVDGADGSPGYLLDKLTDGDNAHFSKSGNAVKLDADNDKVAADNTDSAPGYLLDKLYPGDGIAIEAVLDGLVRKVKISATGGGGGGGSAGAAVWAVHPNIATTQQIAAGDSWKTSLHKIFVPKLTPSHVAFALSYDSSHFTLVARVGIYSANRALCYYGEGSFASAPDYLGLNSSTGEFYSIPVSAVETAPKTEFENEFVILAVSFPSYGSYRPAFLSYGAANSSVRKMTAPITNSLTTLPTPDGEILTRTCAVGIL